MEPDNDHEYYSYYYHIYTIKNHAISRKLI